MTVGSYGSVSFTVSSSVVETFSNMKWTSTANYASHKVHGKKAVNEFTGFDSDKITMEIKLSAFLGVNPHTELEKLNKIMQSTTAHALALGTNVIGGKWVLQNISRDVEVVYKDGALLSVKVQITLVEEV